MKAQRSVRLALILALAPLAGCHIHLDGNSSTWRVDGVRLEEQHTETLEILDWSTDGLSVEIGVGDVIVLQATGPTVVTATIHEYSPGDARMEYENGKLTWTTISGQPAALGNVTVQTNSSLAQLIISTGKGDIEIDGVQVEQKLDLSTGKGDIIVRSAGDPQRGRFSTGFGDIELASLSCSELSASSGMGDVFLIETESKNADLSTGMGDIETVDSRFGFLDAATGMGDIDASRSSYEDADLDTGLGGIDWSDD